MSMVDPNRRKPPKIDPTKPRPARVTSQRRDRLSRDAEYAVLRAIYLEENSICTRPNCKRTATEIHHIVGGTSGRARSLLNSDTWLGVCGTKCHEAVDAMTTEDQIQLKQQAVKDTILRLRA